MSTDVYSISTEVGDVAGISLEVLTNVADRWSRAEAIQKILAQPSPDYLALVESAIDTLVGKKCEPYTKTVDESDRDSAPQAILYYARSRVFFSNPYAVQAMIPFVGGQSEWISRQLRAMPDGDKLYAIYQLLEAQHKVSEQLGR